MHECYVVMYHSNPEEASPVAVYETLEDAKTHESGKWTDDGYGTWDNGSSSIVYCTYWPK